MISRGFLFTISIILFASTLVIFAQLYSNQNLGNETRILKNYKSTSEFFLNDNISSDLLKILGAELSVENNDSGLNIKISDSVPKNYSITDKLVDYNSFLNSALFENFYGIQNIYLENLVDGSYELFFDENFNYSVNYVENDVFFVSNESNLNSIDLNLFFNDDLNYYTWDSESGDLDLNLFYYDNSNYFLISENVSSNSPSELFLYYEDSNIQIVFSYPENSINIDLNSSNTLLFELILNYDFDSNHFPVYINSIIRNKYDNIDSNSMPKLFN